jgi:hypothetical protein
MSAGAGIEAPVGFVTACVPSERLAAARPRPCLTLFCPGRSEDFGVIDVFDIGVL